MRERRISRKDALTMRVRQGQARAETPRRYRVSTRRLDVKPGIDLDRALRIAGELEDAETLSKLASRK